MSIIRSFTSLLVLLIVFSVNSQAQDKIAADAKIFGKLPEYQNLKISPDGTKILMFQNYQGRKILVTRSLTDPNAKQNGIPPFENQEFIWARWANNERILAGVRFAARGNFRELRDDVLSVDTVETRLISMKWDGEDALNPIRQNTKRRRQSQIQANVVDMLRDEPNHVLVGLDYHEQFERGVYKIDIRSDKLPRRVVKGRPVIQSWYSDSDGIVRFGQGETDRQGSLKAREVAYYRKSEDSPWITLYDFDSIKEDIPYYFEGFTDDPNIIYVTKNDENGRSSAYTYNVDTNEFLEKIVSNDQYDIVNLMFTDEGEISGYTFYDKQPRMVFLIDKYQKDLDLYHRSFPNKSINMRSSTKDEKKEIIEVTSPTEPGTYYIHDKDKNSIEMIAYNYQEVDIEKLSEMTPITYEARDGLEIPGYLSLPKEEEPKNLPTIILPHGGPFARDNWRFDWWVQYLTAQGYAVLQMNYRGSTGYGERFFKMGFHEWGRKMIEDINDGTKWMIEQGYTDPDRICIAGGSYGGYAALQAVVKDQSLYKCSVAMSPVANLVSFVNYYDDFGNTNSYLDYIKSDEYSIEEGSPAHNMDKINIPVILFHGKLDRSVRVGQSQYFYEAMKEKNKDIKYIEWEEGDHFFSKENDRIQFLEEMGRFLKKHL